jgi:hypothetical protein
VLIVVPHVVAAAGWQVWMAGTAGCMALFAVAICFFGGPWRGAATATPTAVPPGQVG